MARRIEQPKSGKPKDEPMDETERRLRDDPELADYLRQKRAVAARIAGDATVARDRKS